MDEAPERPTRAARHKMAQHRRRVRIVALGAAVVLVIGVVAAFALSGGGSSKPKAEHKAKPVATTTPFSLPSDAGPFLILTTKVPELPVYPQPTTSSTPVVTLAAKTSYGLPTTLLVQGTTATGHVPTGWLPVLVPLHKPNNTPGFVQLAQVTETATSYVIEVSLSQHMLTLKKSGVTVMSTGVILGTPNTKTPTGIFSITDPLNCNTTSVPGYPLAKCSSVYGAAAIGTSGLSNDLSSFDGTIPQIALHGTDLPSSDLGQNLSNGCVRMPNTAILTIAKIQPLLGTPVFITA
ncbi:MAG TPA: L,D-transpeptidase family protein [Acidimicrobiia bacterium]|nr:L,D-transpeptidase family protein [Acidimicrobiia bacterium]